MKFLKAEHVASGKRVTILDEKNRSGKIRKKLKVQERKGFRSIGPPVQPRTVFSFSVRLFNVLILN